MITPLDILAEALRAAGAYQRGAEAPPETIVWCDVGGEFALVLPLLRALVPGLLTFGDYDPATRTGPALWLRAAAARQVPGVEWPQGEPPIVYLPGYGREVLRGADDCPGDLAPLVWFAVAGVFFSQPKQARDWTLRSFLAAQGSPVGLDIPEDKATREALTRAAGRLFAEPVDMLHGRRWSAAELDMLLVPDAVADVLRWMDGTLTQEAEPTRFDAFAALAVRQLAFDPRKKSRHDAAARLARREKGWAKVWDRFAEARNGYDGVVALLRKEEPDSLVEGLEAYPIVNTRAETELRTALHRLEDAPADRATKSILDFEQRHAWRRSTVWARRGEARLAEALGHLAVLARASPLPAHDARAMADAYAAEGWAVDAAALAALDLVRHGEDREAVVVALRAVHLPWLDTGASALQALAARGGVPFAQPEALTMQPGRVALLFVDGLRMDLAHRLAARLRDAGARVSAEWRWSGFPTATATCKPLASPATKLLAAGPPETLAPTYEGKVVDKRALTKAIEAVGWTCGENTDGSAPIWLEGRSIDSAGESNGAGLVFMVESILDDIAERALRLARQGRRVRIVTDHGFLLMPRGLPQAELVTGLVEPAGKARRVALLKEGAPTGYPCLPWTWDSGVLMATATGVRAFYKGEEYAHGGVSPQECVLPVLEVTTDSGDTGPRVALDAPRWRGLMVKVRAVGGANLMADVRVGSDTSGPSALVKGPKALDDAGEASLGVDTDYEGQTLCIVVHRPEAPDDVLAKLVTRAGG